MSAPFRFGGFDDVRFEMLAAGAGYNAYEAWGRWCKAGSECTKRGSRVLSEAMAVALFGNVEALLAAELGRRVESGIELDLEQGSIEWYGDLKAKRQKAGQVRAQMPRDALGRLLPAQRAATTPPAHAGVLDQSARASSSAPDLSPDPAPARPEQGAPLDLKPPGRGSRRQRAAPLPDTWSPRPKDADTALSERQREHELAKFRDHAQASDRRQVDWDASWRLWQSRATERAPARQHSLIGSASPRNDHPVSPDLIPMSEL